MFSSRSAVASVSLTLEVESDSIYNVSVNTVFSFFDPLTGVCRNSSPYWSLNMYCPSSLPVRIAQGSVSSWLALVILSSSTSISSFNVRIEQGSLSDPLDGTILVWGSQSKLIKVGIWILNSIGGATGILLHISTSPYRTRVCILAELRQ